MKTRKAVAWALFVVALAGIGVLFAAGEPSRPAIKMPVTSFAALVPASSRAMFFGRFKVFAERNGFSVHIGNVSMNSRQFAITLMREDAKVFGSNPFEEQKFRVRFYQGDERSTSEAEIRRLAMELRSDLQGVKGVDIADLGNN